MHFWQEVFDISDEVRFEFKEVLKVMGITGRNPSNRIKDSQIRGRSNLEFLLNDGHWIVNWDAMMGLVLTSENEFVVRFFSKEMLKIYPLYFIRDTRSFGPNTSGLKIDLIGRAKFFLNDE